MDSANNTPAVHEQTAEPYLGPHVWQEWTLGTWLQARLKGTDMENRPGVALYASGGKMVPFSDTREVPGAVKMLPDGNGEQGHHDEAHLMSPKLM